MGETLWKRGTKSGMTESRDTGREQGDMRERETEKWGKQMRSCWFKGMGRRAAVETKQKCGGKRSVQKKEIEKKKATQKTENKCI